MTIYTDGSCRSNGNPDAIGGFGVVAIDEDNHKIFTYGHQDIGTTNNRQEIKAVLYTLFNFGDEFLAPTVYCDSAYVVNIFNDWMFRWANNNWLKSDNKKPENLDLIQAYYKAYQKGYRINLKKIAGHSGNMWNDLADQLAKGEIKPTYKWENLDGK